jgi:hypothetical protein
MQGHASKHVLPTHCKCADNALIAVEVDLSPKSREPLRMGRLRSHRKHRTSTVVPACHPMTARRFCSRCRYGVPHRSSRTFKSMTNAPVRTKPMGATRAALAVPSHSRPGMASHVLFSADFTRGLSGLSGLCSEQRRSGSWWVLQRKYICAGHRCGSILSTMDASARRTSTMPSRRTSNLAGAMQNAANMLTIPPADEDPAVDGKLQHLENTYIMGPRPPERFTRARALPPATPTPPAHIQIWP